MMWEQLCTGSGSVAPSQCKSRVCTASNDIAKAGLATESLELAAHKIGLWACRRQTWICQLAAHQIGSVGLQHIKLIV